MPLLKAKDTEISGANLCKNCENKLGRAAGCPPVSISLPSPDERRIPEN
jgi:hypothetical protein